MTHNGPKPDVYLNVAKDLGGRLLSAFNSSPTSVPYSDVISAHPAPGGMSSTAEVASVQLEFNYLSAVSGDPKYNTEAMKVLAHIKTLPKTEGLVPIYISPQSGEFVGENISRNIAKACFEMYEVTATGLAPEIALLSHRDDSVIPLE
ncbi:unnamed protein product [Eruca vesicaria subsp. sativa]|uniref:mannosyl-oligosaccharide 1,2-alpha-mannosidase n=1 Tax=Eruca vesicaria subsp. sativa TaxID=29727 RepID=A0ABC8KF32_ERUVS|nr:unnamed protein product [Eruca vesicaria subsp. sativa]